jgi:hypothetical protein
MVGFVVAAVVAALTLWRLPRTPAGFAYAVAATSLAFFAFNKQAFCNYYFFVAGAFAVALGACDQTAAERAVVSTGLQSSRSREGRQTVG